MLQKSTFFPKFSFPISQSEFLAFFTHILGDRAFWMEAFHKAFKLVTGFIVGQRIVSVGYSLKTSDSIIAIFMH